MKAYKVFDKNLQCRGFQYEIGKSYKHEGNIEICNAGFHACLKASDCFKYYDFHPNNRVCVVELCGTIIHGKDKSVCNKITIINELKWKDILELINTGKNNTGHHNSGDWNSGNKNSGNGNSGYRNSGHKNSGNGNSGNGNSGKGNSGYYNSGDYNSGGYNSGNSNSGNYNSGNGNRGDWNSGKGNSGYYNSGSYNSCNYETGFFNSIQSNEIRIFNKYININKNDFFSNEGVVLCGKFYIRHYHKKINGKKRRFIHTYKNSWLLWYNELNNKEIELIKTIPCFDSKVFFEITGIKI